MMITTLKVHKDNRQHAQDIDDKWNKFVECFFIRKESYIASHSGEIFTHQRVERVLELFDENTEGEGFDDRLKIQFAEATIEEKLIYLHAEWIYLLMTDNIKDTRREKLSRWNNKIKDDVLLEVIVKPGMHFNIKKYFLVRLILELFRDIFAVATEQNKWIEQYCLNRQSEKHLHGICSALLYIVNPNDYEPIVSKQDKVAIAKYYKNLLDLVDKSVDKNIFNIRQELTKEHGEQHFGFYHERREWLEQGSEQGQDRVKDEKGEYELPKEDNLMKHPLNQILYGPPGTGKTWNTVNHALAIIDGKSVESFENQDRKSVKKRFDELKESGQIDMVTFHQNFAYEDFIEGIRPILGNDSGDESSNLQYEIVDGVFKKIADRAHENLLQSKSDSTEIDLDALLEAYAKNIEERLAEGEEIKFLKPKKSKIYIKIKTVTREKNRDDKFKSFTGYTQTKELIEYKYPLTRKIIERDYGKFYNGEIKIHSDIKRPKTKSKKHSHSDFYFALYGQIKKFQDTWSPEEQRNQSVEKLDYVLIIDEINRGNIAKIFGELITLIEDTKRIGNEDETTVTLPCSSHNDDEIEAFGVPNNLYILGTMNTADRSIALLDTALRRRFNFIEMMPQADHLLIKTDVEGVDCQELLAVMNARITVLLDREHQIGHSYFIGVDSMEKLANAFRNKIMPLLQEYFYDDWEKIQIVLNDNKFVTKTNIENGLLRKKVEEYLVDAERSIYALIEAKNKEWKNPANYQKIYAIKQTEEDSKDDVE